MQVVLAVLAVLSLVGPSQGSVQKPTQGFLQVLQDDLNEEVSELESLAQAEDGVITSDDLEETANQLQDIDELLGDDESVQIGNYTYSKQDVADGSEDRQELADSLDEDDNLIVITEGAGPREVSESDFDDVMEKFQEADTIQSLQNGDYEVYSLEDVDEEIDYYENAIEDLDEDETVNLGGEEYSFDDIDDILSDLESLQSEMDEDDTAYVTDEGYKVVPEDAFE
mmetsp:Transcript_16294/g.23588  ORF Transcript_16294/g.23588 Transcript_16294/m.23588 type:complete len:226 (+) Transcript_16294:40-717(+)